MITTGRSIPTATPASSARQSSATARIFLTCSPDHFERGLCPRNPSWGEAGASGPRGPLRRRKGGKAPLRMNLRRRRSFLERPRAEDPRDLLAVEGLALEE